MPETNWVTSFDHGWVFNYLKPDGIPQNPPLILLHGLSGDENSVVPLVTQIIRSRWMIALRGILQAEDRGYAWAKARSRTQNDFRQSAQAFLIQWPNIRSLLGIESEIVDLFGFSQGAAMASMLLLAKPDLVRRVALVSGFVPDADSSSPLPSLKEHQVLISHGTQDNIIPFERATQAARFFQLLGAEVNFCQSDTRHKISASCLKEVETFFD